MRCFYPGAGVLGDGAQGAHQLGGLGQNVGGGAALELADGQGALLEGRDLPGQKVLKGLIDVHPGVDGVHAVLGHAAVGALAGHGDGDSVAGGHQRPLAGEEGARGIGRVGPDVHGEGRVHMGGLQDAVLQHGLAAGKAQGVGALLVRLEHQLHAAVQLALVLLQQLRRAQQHGGVQVVAAGVGRVALGGKGKAGLLPHGQGVHVRPQQDGLAARLAQGGHNARFAHAPGLIAQLPQLFFHKGAGLGQLKAHLRVAVQPAAVFHQLRLQFFCAFQQFVRHSFASQRMCSAPFFHGAETFC